MQPFDDFDATRPSGPPKLCPFGQLFAEAFREALTLGTNETDSWVISLTCKHDPRLWIQFTDECVNITDAAPRQSAQYIDVSPILVLSSRSPGVYSTFKFVTPADVELVASYVCRYMTGMFPASPARAAWAKTCSETPNLG